ncbi:WD40-repeat-containing domain protein [Suillus clintonianus]|uniref:WD40-repeat-containing domain protein n=1 Tax=Suillus clintonianus TaxID=1904413 RepID=UPI001B85DAB8|nr:WD40-repeat-containing domain protein [Suillus clintonianus]KAG2140054.1 WD40-repeat-containing domain protein [Suillus clintonianus]
MALPAPSPIHLLRSHSSAVSTLFISTDNERIYSGDSAGQVFVTSTRSLRPLASWKAHTDSLLGVEEWGTQLITHGRDNKLHIWARPEESTSIRQGPATLSDLSTPTICYSMDVNALNYCRFSLLFPAEASDQESLLAIPNLVESALADIWSLPSRQRLHAAIGDPLNTSATTFSDGRSGSKSGIIMSMHLFYAASSKPSSSTSSRELRLLCAYENGSVVLRKRIAPENKQTVEGRGWDVLWNSKLHVESVMSMAVSLDCTFALTVSADHLVGRYDLLVDASEFTPAGTAFKTKHPGNGAISIRGDGRVCAIGGWDGKVRLYSTKTLKLLGTLVHHKQGCQAVTFASRIDPHFDNASLCGDLREEDTSGYEDEMSVEEKHARVRWLIAGSADMKVSIWALMNFEKTSA